jgi:glucose/arabinose dehydrogenase
LGFLALAVAAVGASPALAATNLISTVAGTGVAGFTGDGGPATSARIGVPTEVTAMPDGGYLIADQTNSRIRRVAPNGTITTIAGNGTVGALGDGGPATAAQLNAPNGMIRMPDGSILIADSNNNVVRRVAGGVITRVAGTGVAGFSGDNGPATAAQLSFPVALAATSDGGYLISDNDNNRIRRVSPSGTITTVAGTGAASFGGDNGPATSAQLNDPSDVASLPSGGYLIADLLNQRVRRVSPTGTITTVAGTGTASFSGDGGPATAATLSNPINVAATIDGGFLVTDRNNNRIRKVSPTGTIGTAVGTGIAGFFGDGGLATSARINQSIGVDVVGEGDYLIADSLNNRIRRVDAAEAVPAAQPQPLPPPVLGKKVNVQLVRGRVLIAVPAGSARSGSARAAQKGLKFVPLKGSQQIPVRSFLDTKRGTVRLISATRTQSRGIQSGEFSRGLFQVLQSGKRSARGLTELRLKGSSFRRCRRTSRAKKKKASSSARRRSKRVIRRLRGNAKGRFRTRGRYSSATVRGTIWTTTDRCDGTLTKVSRGRVAVRDLRRKKNISLRRGKSYLARAPG